MMFGYFHSKGTTPSFSDNLNTLASSIRICSTVSISNLNTLASSIRICSTVSISNLNTLASSIRICSTVSISSFGGIPSIPGYLLSFIAFLLATISGVTNNCPI